MNDGKNMEIPQFGIFPNEAKEIKALHSIFILEYQGMVIKGIQIGKKLAEVKKKFIGDFSKWVESELKMPHSTAWRYLDLYEYQEQIKDSKSVTEAHDKIKAIETQKRQTETQKAHFRIAEYRRTGKKPEGWRQHTDDKLLKEESDRDARIEKVFAEKAKESEKKKTEQLEWERKSDEREKKNAELKKYLDESTKVIDKRIAFMDKIRISSEGKTEPFLDAIMDYLDSLTDDNRRIEACYNIIKICKRIANELSVVKK